MLPELIINPLSAVSVTEADSLKASMNLEQMARDKGWLRLLWEPISTKLLEGRQFPDFDNWSPLFQDNLVEFKDFLNCIGMIRAFNICY
jgi:hypothetical protein